MDKISIVSYLILSGDMLVILTLLSDYYGDTFFQSAGTQYEFI